MEDDKTVKTVREKEETILLDRLGSNETQDSSSNNTNSNNNSNSSNNKESDNDKKKKLKEEVGVVVAEEEEKKQEEKKQGEKPLVYPRPKYVLSIITPDVFALPNSMMEEEWEQFTFKRREAASKKNNNANTTTLHLHLLLVSMLNRFIRQKDIPREAMTIFSDPDTAFSNVQILLPATLLPIVVSECERLGVGSMAGMVYACPLETSSIPDWGTLQDQQIVAQEHVVQNMIPKKVPVVAAVVPSAVVCATPPLSRQNSMVETVPADATKSMSSALPLGQVLLGTAAVTGAAAAAAVTTATVAAPAPPALTGDLAEPPMPSPEDIRRTFSNPEEFAWGGAPMEEGAGEENGNGNGTTNKNDENNKKDNFFNLSERGNKKELKENIRKVSTRTGDTAVLSDDGDAKSGDSVRASGRKDIMAKLKQKVVMARKEWLDTASRVRVEQVAEEVTAAASLTWDYSLYVICAAVIASMGLMTDSSVTTLASMLVSPIMGPVMGFTFGTMIHRKKLVVTGLRNELISLFLCVVIGFIAGIIGSASRAYEHLDWPSSEMESRGQATGLVTGIVVALPSGVATALSTLNKNSSGLVGVAISLSLLPPAVNAGLCWAYELMLLNDNVDRNDGDSTDYEQTGTISFALTLINIICIWMAGTFTFYMKEVSPLRRTEAFWHRDVIVARQQEQKSKAASAQTIAAGVRAADDLKMMHQDGKHVTFDDDVPRPPPPQKNIQRSLSESKLAGSGKTRMQELVRARDSLFDDSIFSDVEEDEPSEPPALPEDFTGDQSQYVRRILGAYVYS